MAPSNSSSTNKPLKDVNPSQLGDPVSLKAETSNNSPTEHDTGAKGVERNDSKQTKDIGGKDKGKDKETLKEKVEKNPTALGDPVSLKAEQSSYSPTEEEKGAHGDKGDKGEKKSKL